MRLAISNLAWSPANELTVADRLPTFGIAGVELACTKVWPHPLEVSDCEIARVRHFWDQRGLPIVALQSLLFEKPDLRIFADADQRAEATAYLRGMIQLAEKLGAKALVFGSPKNRRIDPRTSAKVWPDAVEFFRDLGEYAAECDTCLCLEPNPPNYGCDFLTCAAEARQMVLDVDRPGLRLHLDSACMALAGDEPAATFRNCAPLIGHFHISEPNLGPVGAGAFDHATLGRSLAEFAPVDWVSIEMKPAADELAGIECACAAARANYLMKSPTTMPLPRCRRAPPATEK